jgi:PAS domain S-box-containing protein
LNQDPPLPSTTVSPEERVSALEAELAAVRAERDAYRRELALATHESQRSFQDLADAMPQLVWTTQPDGYHDYFNRRWHDYTNTMPGDTDDWGWQRLLHPDDVERADAVWRHSLETGEPYEIAYRFRNGKTGEYRWFVGRALPGRDAEGRITRWYGTCTDIQAQVETETATREANEELEAANEELLAQQIELASLAERLRARNEQIEAIVAVRTRELTVSQAALGQRNQDLQAINEELASQAEELQQADKYKDEFLSVISHELRTPLNFIMGFASTLDDEVQGPLNDRQHDAIAKILSGADRMTAIVDDLLDYARMQAGRFRLACERVEITPLVAEVTAAAQPVATARDVRIEIQVAGAPRANVDAARVIQVLNNLVGNAVKFTEPGGRIVISVRPDGPWLRLEVTDDGVGIAPSDQHRLFTRFQQLDMTNTRQAGGTGLGLAISKAIVEAHGGAIGVTSPGVGLGSTFWFTLPAEAPEA